ncbi:hypothetical protein BaRGS_00038520 [Batillaria attramentaria]|uniref:Uncharacterized protein n=1 Tax=Batillaria attramentaria TaxID=370345 RepID=A0ABD0J5F8_9CAEN
MTPRHSASRALPREPFESLHSAADQTLALSQPGVGRLSSPSREKHCVLKRLREIRVKLQRQPFLPLASVIKSALLKMSLVAFYTFSQAQNAGEEERNWDGDDWCIGVE